MTIKKSDNQNDILQTLEAISGEALTFQSFMEAIRKGEGWSKKEMTEILSISQSYYSDFLAGKKSVSIRKAAEWARILGYHEPSFIEYAFQEELKRANLNHHYIVEVKEVS